MIYINHNNIYMLCNKSHAIIDIPNDTEHSPLCTYNNILLMSDGKLYTVSRNNKLLVVSLKESDCATDFTNSFAKINSEYYEICETSLLNIPFTANNVRNIIKICHRNILGNNYYYYHVNNNNILNVYDVRNSYGSCVTSRYTILDCCVSLILHCDGNCIIYMKKNKIVYSRIRNFTQLPDRTNRHVIYYTGQPITKSSDSFILDSHNNLYALVMNDEKFDLKKISDGVIDFYCDKIYVYITDAMNMIYCINKCDYSSKYIGAGHFGKALIYNKSANNSRKQICE
jgi:hypothetical protein